MTDLNNLRPGDVVNIVIKGARISDKHTAERRLWFVLSDGSYQYLPKSAEGISVNRVAPDLTFTASAPAEGLRHWDLRGPAGLVRFETADALGIRTSSVYLHAAVAPAGGELEDCFLCGKCWHDAMLGQFARGLREEWEAAAYHDAVIRTQLERWYAELLAPAADRPAEDQAVPGKDLPMVLAKHAPDIPFVAAIALATALDQAGYQLVRVEAPDVSP